MADLVDLERKIQRIYDGVLRELADWYSWPLPRGFGQTTGWPTVLLLGNHSSGKSSFINYLLDQEVQKTGLAPVDDGFTVIAYGDTDEFDGQTVVSHPELPFRALERFGPGFLSHLRLKTRSIDLLKALTLIDSPGMIDSADTASGRNYDFLGVVRDFSDRADLILFFFDPDKPGTTGETLSVFLKALDGVEHKLLILMNKVDQLHNIRDFARAYGALCWNLSKVTRTKDIPHVFCTYIPQLVDRTARERRENRIPLEDFDISRDEVVTEIERTSARRADNLVTALREQCRRVAMHSRVCAEIANRVRRVRTKFSLSGATVTLLALLVVFLAWGQVPWYASVAIGSGGLALGALSLWLGKAVSGRDERTMVEGLNGIFESLYFKELQLDDRADLRGRWDSVKPRVRATLDAVGAANLPRTRRIRRRLRRLDRTLKNDVPRLCRTIELESPALEAVPVAPARVAD